MLAKSEVDTVRRIAVQNPREVLLPEKVGRSMCIIMTTGLEETRKFCRKLPEIRAWFPARGDLNAWEDSSRYELGNFP